MLPVNKKIDEVGRRYRFNLAAHLAQGQTMNAREQYPIAPLDVFRILSAKNVPGELTAHRHPSAFQGKQRGVDFIDRQANARRERRGADRSAHFEPALNDFLDGVFRRRHGLGKTERQRDRGGERNLR